MIEFAFTFVFVITLSFVKPPVACPRRFICSHHGTSDLLRKLLGLQGIRFHGLLNSFPNCCCASDLSRCIFILLRHQSLGLFGEILDFGEAFPLEGHGSFEPGDKFIALLDEGSQLTRISPSIFILADLSQQFLPQRHKFRHTS